MEWLIFALLCPAFWGWNNVINKFLMTKKFPGYFSITIYLNLLDLIFAGIVCLFVPISLEFPYFLFSIAAGVLPLFSFWFYSKALMVEEVSRISPLFQFIPIFVVFLSILFLGEILSAQKYFGIALIVLTSILISYKKSENGNSLSSAFKYMVPFSAILAVFSTINKHLLGHMDYWSVFFWSSIGSALGVLAMLAFSKPRKEFVEALPILGKRTFFVSLLGESTYILGILFSLAATSLSYVSVVSALSGLQHFFVFVYMVLISLFVPKILKEELNRNVLALKILSIAVMFVGTWLITM